MTAWSFSIPTGKGNSRGTNANSTDNIEGMPYLSSKLVRMKILTEMLLRKISTKIQLSSQEITTPKSIFRKNQKRVVYVMADMAGELESPAYAILGMEEKLKEIKLTIVKTISFYVDNGDLVSAVFILMIFYTEIN